MSNCFFLFPDHYLGQDTFIQIVIWEQGKTIPHSSLGNNVEDWLVYLHYFISSIHLLILKNLVIMTIKMQLDVGMIVGWPGINLGIVI